MYVCDFRVVEGIRSPKDAPPVPRSGAQTGVQSPQVVSLPPRDEFPSGAQVSETQVGQGTLIHVPQGHRHLRLSLCQRLLPVDEGRSDRLFSSVCLSVRGPPSLSSRSGTSARGSSYLPLPSWVGGRAGQMDHGELKTAWDGMESEPGERL